MSLWSGGSGTVEEAVAGDEFGGSVAISGHTLVVGAMRDDDAGFESGSAYVFDRNQGGADNWGEVATQISRKYLRRGIAPGRGARCTPTNP